MENKDLGNMTALDILDGMRSVCLSDGIEYENCCVFAKAYNDIVNNSPIVEDRPLLEVIGGAYYGNVWVDDEGTVHNGEGTDEDEWAAIEIESSCIISMDQLRCIFPTIYKKLPFCVSTETHITVFREAKTDHVFIEFGL